MKASAFTTELRMIDCMPLSVMFTAWRKQYADICQLELFFSLLLSGEMGVSCSVGLSK